MLTYPIETRQQQGRLVRGEAPLLQVLLDYPMCTGGAPAHSLDQFNRHYLGMTQKALSDARGSMSIAALRHRNRNIAAGVPFAEHSLRQDCEVTYNERPWLSVVCDTRRTESAVHAVVERRADTWDMEAGHMVTLRDLFQPGYDYKKTIMDYIERTLAGTGQPDIKQLRAHFRERDFYLSRKGLAVFFPLAQLGPYQEDVPVYTVPFSEFEGIRL